MSFNFNANQSIFTKNNLSGVNAGAVSKNNFGNFQNTGISNSPSIFLQQKSLSAANNKISTAAPQNNFKIDANAQNGGGFMNAIKTVFGQQKGDVVANARAVLARAEALTGMASAEQTENKEENSENKNKGLNVDI